MHLQRLVLAIYLALMVNALPLTDTTASARSLAIDGPCGLDMQAEIQHLAADQAWPEHDIDADFECLNTGAECPAGPGQTDRQRDGAQMNLDRRGRHGNGSGHRHSGQEHNEGAGHEKSGGHRHSDQGRNRRHRSKSGGNDKHRGNQKHGGNSRKDNANSQSKTQQTNDKNSGSRGGDTFAIHVENQCSDAKHVSIYGVTSNYQAVQHGKPVKIAPGQSHTLQAPFHGIGLRLTANAQEGKSNVFQAQSLFEFGYSQYAGQEGTSYDLSLMPGSQIGMAVDVLDNDNGSGSCESKKCVHPSGCAASQAWTNPNQSSLGSPADTTCYKGKTAFKVTLCPN